jgi:N6-L-threonylcarbamoyladenine synthase
MLHSGDLSFSFSGLKTAVLTARPGSKELTGPTRPTSPPNSRRRSPKCLPPRPSRPVARTGFHQLVVAGGVGANRRLRQRLDEAMARIGGRVFYPALDLCTDNGAMIAFCGAQRLLQGEVPAPSAGAFAIRPRWPLDQVA